MSEAEIYANAARLGPELTARLLEERKRLQNPDDLADAKLDSDTLIRIASRAGLDGGLPEDLQTLGELRQRARQIFASEQRSEGSPLGWEAKAAIVKHLVAEDALMPAVDRRFFQPDLENAPPGNLSNSAAALQSAGVPVQLASTGIPMSLIEGADFWGNSETNKKSMPTSKRQDEPVSPGKEPLDTGSEASQNDEDRRLAIAEAGGHQVFGPPKDYEGQLPNGMSLRNPTGGDIRLPDNYGHGYYGAPRQGGGSHAGVDVVGNVGQQVDLPFAGNKNIIGSGYDRGVMITHPSGKYRVLLLHIDPQKMEVLDPVQYGLHGMTPHVHFQLEQSIGGHWRNVDPTPILYPAQQ